MKTTVRNHIRSNVVGYIALFVALSGTAAALPGSNTVDSGDIINKEVKTGDIGPGQVRTVDVADDNTPNALTGSDVADGSLSGSDVANGSLTGSDVEDGSLTGSDVSEGTLGQVPGALVGGFGRSFGGGNCFPTSTNFIDCGYLSLNLPSQSRVLLNGRVRPFAAGGTTEPFGECRLVTSLGVLANTTITARDWDALPLTTVTGPLGPGSVDFGVECNETVGDIAYQQIGLSAVAIAPN